MKSSMITLLRIILFAMLGIGVFSLLLWGPERMVQWAVSGPQEKAGRLTPEQYAKLLDDNRKTLAQVLIGLGALGTLYFSWKRSAIEQETLRVTQENLRVAQQNLETTRDSKITERFSKAVEQLGAVNKDGFKALEVRFGGIYALERIARDSPNDHWPVMEILTAYVRQNAPWKEQDPIQHQAERPKPQIDIQAILTVIGRRKREHEEGKEWVLDLQGTDLRGADLERAHLAGAILYNTHLENASLREAHLEGAMLVVAHLEGANLTNAHMQAADLAFVRLDESVLRGAHLEGADVSRAEIEGSDLTGAHLYKTDLRYSQLKTALGLTREQIRVAIINPETGLPEELRDLIGTPTAEQQNAPTDAITPP